MSKTQRKNSKKNADSLFSPLVTCCLILGFLVLALDQGAKSFVYHHIPRMNYESLWHPYNGIGVFEDFFGIDLSIVHRTNKGAAWGIFADYPDYLLAFRILLITGLFLYLVLYNKNKVWTLPLTLIIVGAVSNVIDYFVFGHVVDLIKFVLWDYHYPVFNIADSAIFIGVCSMIFLTMVNKKESLCKNA